jgi:hypothetical protein
MTLNVTGEVYDTGDKASVGGKTSGITQTSTLKKTGRVTVQTSEVDINHSSEISTPGWVALENVGSTDRIDIGFTTAVYDLSLKPGESCSFRVISTASARLFVKAVGANDTENLEYAIHSD